MWKTLDEAGKVICPKTMGNDIRDRCIGDLCMAWRWLPQPDNKRKYLHDSQRKATVEPPGGPKGWVWVPYDEIEGTGAHWLEPDKEAEARRAGWCGLAGEVP